MTTNSPGCWFSNTQVFIEAQLGSDRFYDYPFGLVGFTVNCAVADVSVIFTGASDLSFTPYRKHGPTTPGDPSTIAWYNFDNVDVSGNTYILHLKDGGLLGDDSPRGILRSLTQWTCSTGFLRSGPDRMGHDHSCCLFGDWVSRLLEKKSSCRKISRREIMDTARL